MTETEDRKGSYQFDYRQVVSAVFVAIVLMGICMTVAYVAGRTVPAASAQKLPSATAPARPVAVPPVAEPEAVTPSPVPAPASVKPETETRPNPVTANLPAGTYLQVAAVERGIAEALMYGLRHAGHKTEMTAGPTPTVFRVLVGPMASTGQLERTMKTLEAGGFRPFVRQQPKAEPPMPAAR